MIKSEEATISATLGLTPEMTSTWISTRSAVRSAAMEPFYNIMQQGIMSVHEMTSICKATLAVERSTLKATWQTESAILNAAAIVTAQ